MNIISKIYNYFNREPPARQTQVAAVSIPNANFSTWQGNAYTNDIYRGAVDAIARNAAKLKGVHVVTYDGQKIPAQDKLQNLLQVSPNKYLTAYDLLYKIVSQVFLNNNAFCVLDFDDRHKLQGIYPLNYTHIDLKIDSQDRIFAEFTFKTGKKSIFAYSDLIHIRRHFCTDDFLGSQNVLDTALELANTQNQGLMQGIKNSANLRGILKFTQLLGDEKLREMKENFVRDYLTISNDGGIVALDTQTEYLPIENKAVNIDAAQLQATKDKIYSYLGISEKIVNSSYSEDDFAAFYESVIEPLAVNLSLEFTRKIFTEREIAFGNQIIFESGRLQFSSNKTKIELLKELIPLGILTINQGLEVLNLPPVEDGDKRLLNLNYIEMAIANKYQLGKAGYSNGNNDTSSTINTIKADDA